jgi:hypothetical protein
VIKKIIIFGLIVVGAFFFYKKFMAGILEPFFKEKSGKVDFFGQKMSDYKVEK